MKRSTGSANFRSATNGGARAGRIVRRAPLGFNGRGSNIFAVVAASAAVAVALFSSPTALAATNSSASDSCELPEGRCFEIVSPREAGPTAQPGRASGPLEVHFQAGSEGVVAYASESGFPDSTKGAEVLSLASRTADQWTARQLSPPLTSVNRTVSDSSASSKYWGLNEALSCGFVSSNQPLTQDVSANAALEEGGVNLYRRNSDGGYVAITRQAPTNFESVDLAYKSVQQAFVVQAFSEDCSKVIFSSKFTYPGVEVPSGEPPAGYVYEWQEGTLRSVTVGPGAESPQMVGTYDASNADASRVFFSSGHIFVRENGQITRDVSPTETSEPNEFPEFAGITEDGGQLFFFAEAGLTEPSSAEGRDLYRYDLASEDLIDMTAVEESAAEAEGYVGSSADGAYVYFVARGQLVPGEGPTLAQNETEDRTSLYVAHDGEVRYVAPFSLFGRTPRDLGLLHTDVAPRLQTARVAGGGRYLLFEALGNVTGYEGGDQPQVYLFDASGSSVEALQCVSCRRDGLPPVQTTRASELHLSTASIPANSLKNPTSIVIRDGRPVVFFSSFDALTQRAGDGRNNIYEWTGGEASLIASEPAGLSVPEEKGDFVLFGASNDGTDLYFATTQALTWEDGDARLSIYDARIGGGFPAPPFPPADCDPLIEQSCRPSVSGSETVPSAGSQSFQGAGNLRPRHKKSRRKHHKKKNQKNGHRRHHHTGRTVSIKANQSREGR